MCVVVIAVDTEGDPQAPPVKEGRLAVQCQLRLLTGQKANKCWMHTMPGYASVDVEEAVLEGTYGARTDPGAEGARADANAELAGAASNNTKCSDSPREQVGVPSILIRSKGESLKMNRGRVRAEMIGEECVLPDGMIGMGCHENKMKCRFVTTLRKWNRPTFWHYCTRKTWKMDSLSLHGYDMRLNCTGEVNLGFKT